MMTKKSNIGKFERHSIREPIIVRAQAPQALQEGLFLRPSFAISAQGGALTVNVSARRVQDPTRPA